MLLKHHLVPSLLTIWELKSATSLPGSSLFISFLEIGREKTLGTRLVKSVLMTSQCVRIGTRCMTAHVQHLQQKELAFELHKMDFQDPERKHLGARLSLACKYSRFSSLPAPEGRFAKEKFLSRETPLGGRER